VLETEYMLKPPTPSGAAALPPQPFFALAPQRVRLARERYFDDGQRPTGLVAEPVIQSWARCISAHQRPQDAIAFDPVSRSRMHAALARNRHLLLAAGDELRKLEAAVGGTGCRVLLTDADGVVVHATSGPARARELLPIVSRVGVNLAESAVGTNAPAVVLKTGHACAVSGAEHFFDSVQRLHCAAAPIHDSLGGVAAVLDLTVEARPFGFDASALVAVVATAIENRLLQQGTEEQLVLRFQVSHSLLGSPLEALVGVAGSGRLAWANGTAQQLLGLAGLRAGEHLAAESLFGQRLDDLLALATSDTARTCHLPNGLTVWMRAQGPGRGERSAAIPVGAWPNAGAEPESRHAHPQHARSHAADHPDSGLTRDAAQRANEVSIQAACSDRPADTMAAEVATSQVQASALPQNAGPDALVPRLIDHQRELIDRVLAECDGNISLAARRLGVSRGLLYRRRRDQAAHNAQTGLATGPADTTGDHD
jgi:sigma-54 dependent transcriptional regulator, acetoin dehydrogenase operon transcriptional activator AcoR